MASPRTLGPRLILAGLIVSLPGGLEAAELVVAPGDSVGLINAINAANATPAADTIELASGTYSVDQVVGDAEACIGLPSITSTITIRGASLDNGEWTTVITRGPAAGTPPFFRLFHVTSAGRLTLDRVRVTNGDLRDDLSICTSSDGGGILNENGSVTLIQVDLKDNKAVECGGGLRNDGGTLSVFDSWIRGNRANFSCSGGGIFSNGGTLLVERSTISGNRHDENGAGISAGGNVTINNSTVSGNTSGNPISGMELSGTVKLSFVTVTANEAFDPDGIGVNFNGSGVMLDHTLIAGNTGQDCSGAFTSNGNNLIGNNDGCTINNQKASDLVGTGANPIDPLLGPLGNGAPPVHPLLAGSPAIDASPIDKDCAATDQRGAFRPQGPACDIGAFEAGVEPDPFASPTPTTGCTVNGVPDQLCRGTSGPDRIIGTPGNDVIVGLMGDDYVNGSSGEDRLFGGEDNDRLIGGNDDDQLLGQTGDDDLRGRVGNDLLEGGDGNDRLKGHEGDDQLSGGDGDDALRGLAGQDILEGGAGSDLLLGDGGFDTLNGGPGTDRLVGGGGTDRCTSDAEDNIVVLCE